MILFYSFLILLPLIVADDVLRDHLDNLIDLSVNPCDDFYSHVCKNGTSNDQFVVYKMRFAYTDLSKMFRKNASRHNQILIDVDRMKRGNSTLVKNMKYEELARQRCGNDLDCYRADRNYFKNKLIFFIRRFIEVGTHDEVRNRDDIVAAFDSAVVDTVETESSNEDLPANIQKTIAETTRFIQGILPIFSAMSKSYGLGIDLHIYPIILGRIQMVEFLEKNSTFGDLHEINNFTNKMKDHILEKINSSQWLHKDEITRAVLAVILNRISSIKLNHDFDDIDRTMLPRLEKEYRELYYSNKERITGVEEFDISLRLIDASSMMEKNFTNEMADYFGMIGSEYEAGAYYTDHNSILVTAPFLSKKMVSSELVKEALLTYCAIGHELFHSLFSETNSIINFDYVNFFGKRGRCLKDHYGETCKDFQGDCANSNKTIYEDGSDAEGLRVLYEMFEKDHSAELYNTIGYRKMTLIQAFFYYTSIFHCEEGPPSKSGEHSSGHVRVNAVVSLMPEFSRAFGCKKGDRMFTEEPKCQIFGNFSY